MPPRPPCTGHSAPDSTWTDQRLPRQRRGHGMPALKARLANASPEQRAQGGRRSGAVGRGRVLALVQHHAGAPDAVENGGDVAGIDALRGGAASPPGRRRARICRRRGLSARRAGREGRGRARGLRHGGQGRLLRRTSAAGVVPRRRRRGRGLRSGPTGGALGLRRIARGRGTRCGTRGGRRLRSGPTGRLDAGGGGRGGRAARRGVPG